MNLGIQEIICVLVIIFFIVRCVKNVGYTWELEDAIFPILSGASTIVTFFIMVGYYEKFDSLATVILKSIFQNIINDNGLFHIVVLIGIFFLIKFLVYLLFKLLHYFSLKSITKQININKNRSILLILSILFGAIRGMIVIILLTIPFVLYNGLSDYSKRITLFDGMKVYDQMERMIDEKKVESISSGLIENISTNKIIYYNGITVDEGIKSNNLIDEKAKYITKRSMSDYDKAKDIYKWVGSNIDYDDNKAEKVISKDKDYESGAIVTFKTRKGICFDYSCLYTAMAQAVGLKTRIIIGEAYNGNEYVSHAWNQVYIEEENRWVNLDSTFYVAGNYFDNSNFNEEHKMKSIAGEF